MAIVKKIIKNKTGSLFVLIILRPVLEKATARLSNQKDQISAEEEDLSPLTPLPLYQQRDNFYT